MKIGHVWHNGKEVKQFSYTVYKSNERSIDVRPYVSLPTKRGTTKIPVHVLQMQSNFGYRKGFDICHLNEDKFDNRLSNLTYMTRLEHRKYDGPHFKKLPHNMNIDLSYMRSKSYRSHHKFDDHIMDYV